MRIAFVDMEFHKKTLSTQFIPTLLSAAGHQVDFFWDESLTGGANVSINAVKQYDAIVMFQVECLAKYAFAHYSKNITYIPMLDSHYTDDSPVENDLKKIRNQWRHMGNIKLCNFSKKLHNIHQSVGLYSKYFQYFQPPQVQQRNAGLHGFFWARRNDLINLSTIHALIQNTHFDSFHLHLPSDPAGSEIEIAETFKNNVDQLTTSRWFSDKNAFFAQLRKANVFFAPRPVEGIGQSFLEAMSYGICVVAPDFGTMNEYIIHNGNGLLYNRVHPKPLDFSHVECLADNAYFFVQDGYKKWRQSENDIVSYIITPNEDCYTLLSCKKTLFPPSKITTIVKNNKFMKFIKDVLRPTYHFIKKHFKLNTGPV